MKVVMKSVLLLICIFSATIADAKRKEYLALTLGLTEERKISNMPASIGDELNYNRNIVKIAVATSLKTIRFEPVAPGRTNFILRDEKGQVVKEYEITVRKTNLTNVAAEIKKLVGDIEGITIKIINGKVVLDGEVLLPRDVDRIFSVLKQFGPEVASSLVRLSPLAQKKIAEQIERDIGNPEIRVRSVNEKFILEGVASSEAEKQKAEIIAKTYVPDVIVEEAEAAGLIKKRKIDSVINLLSVKPGPEPQPGKTIKLVVHYVELQRDYSKSFRFDFRPTISDGSGVEFSSGGATSNGGVIGAITGTINNLLPKLNSLKTHGHARVLQSSSIIVQDGNPGIIKSITRVPYTAQNQYGQLSTSFAEAGIDTNITPNLVSAKSDSISLTITFSLKTLVGNSDKGPLISDRSIQTRVVVRDQQSAAIGGLVSNDASMGYNRLPSGADPNPLISLYASKQFQQNKSQFVIFITPVIMNSASEGSEDVKKKFRMKD